MSLRPVLIAGTIAGLLVPATYGQVLPKNRAPGATAPSATGPSAKAPGPVPAQPAAPAAGETPGQTRREGREQARDARAEARQAGETGPQARETARETRQATRQNIQATHPADMGVWFNNRAANGLVVSDVTNNSVLANAGLRSGDQIVSLNGQPITTQAQFMQYLTGPNLGTSAIPLIVTRNGAQQTLNLQPTALTQGIVNHDPLYQYGIVIDDRNPNQIVVLRVYPRTPAYYAGLRQGDIITTVNGQTIANVNAFTQLLTQASGPLALQVTRGGQTQDLQLAALDSQDSSVRTALRPNFDGANINAQGGANVAAPGVNVTTPGINTTTPGANITAPGASITAPGVNVTTPGASATLPGASAGAAGSTQGSLRTGSGTTPPAAQPAIGTAPQAGAGATPQAGAGTTPQAGVGAGASGSAGASAPGAGTGAGAGAKTGAGAGTSGTGAGTGAGASGAGGTGTPK